MNKIAPKFSQPLKVKQEPTALTFSCEVEANPRPTITWYRGETKLDASDRIKVRMDPVPKTTRYLCSLAVTKLAPADYGVYKVDAKNQAGNKNTTLAVEG